jgi:hypothetical protein
MTSIQPAHSAGAPVAPAATLASSAQPPATEPGWLVHYGSAVKPAQQQDDWQRPSQWLPLPVLNSQDERFVGLVAVHPDAPSSVAVAAAGSFQVDWGDGTQQIVASPSPALAWWSFSTHRQQVTSELELDLQGDELAWLNRQPETMAARYGGLSGLLPSSRYRLELRDDNRVWLLLDPPLWPDGIGYSLNLRWLFATDSLQPTVVRHDYDYANCQLQGTDTSWGYRQAIVSVTPLPSERLTALHLQDGDAHPTTISSWLDVAIASPVLTDLRIGKSW